MKSENGKRSFVSLSSERQTKHGRSSCRLVRGQLMLAKVKGERLSLTLFLLPTLANRDPHGTTMPCYVRLFTARIG
ncbi:MAG: hypothetical protein UHT92_00430 [Prevotella sp.]|nr:hypothetical protein [Prevotella sp.]